MDKLDEIFVMQHAFDQEVIEKRKLQTVSFSDWMQKECLAITAELAEILDEVNYRWWKNPKEIEMEKVKEELVDVLHFLISMCLKTGMDGEELHQRYLIKNQENFDRQHGKSEKQGYEIKEGGFLPD